MHRTLIAAAVAALACAAPADAGVYSTTQPPVWPLPSTLKDLQVAVGELRSIAVSTPITRARRQYLDRAAAFEEKKKRGEPLSVSDRIDLSEVYIRLGNKSEEACAILEGVPADQRNFMVLANLATAHDLAGRPERAIVYQSQALAAWPEVWAGFDPAQSDFYRRSERYYLKLLQLRYQESQRRPGTPYQSVDDLFSKVRFIGRGGKYEPGQIAPEYADELPAEAPWVTAQLVFWLPLDDRLYWLLAEVHNARGWVYPAWEMMDELVNARRNSSAELRSHRKVLTDVLEPARALYANKLSFLAALGWSLAPRGGIEVPVAGSLIHEAAREAGWRLADMFSRRSSGLAMPAAARADSPPAASFRTPDWRQVAIGFVAGVLVTVFATLQLRESRRRRQQQHATAARAQGRT
jgi:tetratricopeptide (TPR) repeat protein